MCASFSGVLIDASTDISLCLLPVCLSACLSVCLHLPLDLHRSLSVCLSLAVLLSLSPPPFISHSAPSCHSVICFYQHHFSLLSHPPSPLFSSLTHPPLFFFFFFPGVNVRRCRLCSPHQAHGAPAVRVWAVWFVPTYCGVKKEKGGRNGTLNCSETGCEEAHPLRKPPLNLRCTVQPYIIKAKWILWKKSTSWISYFLPSRSIF